MFEMPMQSEAMAQFKLCVALGLVPGWRSFRKFGMNNQVAVATDNEMWPHAGPRTPPTTAGVGTVVSDNAADDADPAGTGAWTVVVEGLDANGDEVSEVFTMNGITGVVGTVEFLHVNRMYVLTAGTGETNAGHITVSVGGNVQYMIEVGEGQSHQTHYTVPAGHVLLIDYYKVSVGRMAGSTDLDILGQVKLATPDSAWRSISDLYLWNGGQHSNDSSMTALPQLTQIRQRISSSTTTQANGIVGGFLVDMKYLQGAFAGNASQVNPHMPG